MVNARMLRRDHLWTVLDLHQDNNSPTIERFFCLVPADSQVDHPLQLFWIFLFRPKLYGTSLTSVNHLSGKNLHIRIHIHPILSIFKDYTQILYKLLLLQSWFINLLWKTSNFLTMDFQKWTSNAEMTSRTLGVVRINEDYVGCKKLIPFLSIALRSMLFSLSLSDAQGFNSRFSLTNQHTHPAMI